MASKALFDVQMERRRQDMKWGVQNHPDGTSEYYRAYADEAREDCKRLNPVDWTAILLEETYEALSETDPIKLRAELIQVAAVAVAWAEAIDRRQKHGI